MATYMIKRTATAAHIAGLATASGREIHSISGDAETGGTFGELRDTVNAINATALPFCRTCRVASELILNREIVNEYWTVTNRQGKELATVWGALHADAVAAAELLPEVLASSKRQGGYGLRRLTNNEALAKGLI